MVAGDLSLLGMPFLLSKAANAATDFDARECPETAKAFLRACLDVRALFDHPELAGLGGVAAQLNPPPLIPLPSPSAMPAGSGEVVRRSRTGSVSSLPGTIQPRPPCPPLSKVLQWRVMHFFFFMHQPACNGSKVVLTY